MQGVVADNNMNLPLMMLTVKSNTAYSQEYYKFIVRLNVSRLLNLTTTEA